MKTLLLENYYSNKNYLPTLFLILIFYGIVFISSMGYVTYIVISTSVFAVSILSRSLFMDSQYKWFYSALSLPINRKRFIQSKFLIMYLSLIIGFLVSILISYVYYLLTKETLNEPWDVIVMILSLGLSYNVIFLSLGIFLNFLYENGKYLLSITYLIPIGIIFIAVKFFHLNLDSIMSLVNYSPIIAVIISFILYLLTVRVFSRRDL